MYKYNPAYYKRIEVYKNGNLPYSFNYKMRLRYVGEKCPVCGCVMKNGANEPTIQHNKPISKGGEHRLENISIFCKKCNISIGNTETPINNTQDVIDKWFEVRSMSNKELINRIWNLKNA